MKLAIAQPATRRRSTSTPADNADGTWLWEVGVGAAGTGLGCSALFRGWSEAEFVQLALGVDRAVGLGMAAGTSIGRSVGAGVATSIARGTGAGVAMSVARATGVGVAISVARGGRLTFGVPEGISCGALSLG
jgi:hypothetical protein